jgi:2-C-methyl-D-erythritol 4-phosphate cytidylyltransferase
VETLDLIVLAAGEATRLGEPVAKQFLDLCGKPVIIHALSTFENLPYVGTKFIAVQRDDVELADHLLRNHKITNFEIVCGGKTRQESVRLALQHVRTRRVITHNAALPFVTKLLIDNVVREDYCCVTTVTPVQQSLCRGDEFARQMVPPEGLKLINTPQSFHTAPFRKCHRKANEDHLVVRTDCELMLHYGYRVKFVQGVSENFKITTPLDMILARALASSER